MKLERRFDDRLPLETYLTAYFDDRPQRGFTVDLSERGLYLSTLAREPQPPRTPVGLELKLPGLPDVIWAAGETRRDTLDDYFYGLGIRFVAMASRHERMLRDYCLRLRRRSSGLFLA
jgi:hypothetical protein